MRIRPEWREEEIERGRDSGEKIDRINNKNIVTEPATQSRACLRQ